jgi:hypothetical protein
MKPLVLCFTENTGERGRGKTFARVVVLGWISIPSLLELMIESLFDVCCFVCYFGPTPSTMNDFGSDAFESVLFVVRECFVYRIPPRKATAGYKAAEWGDMEAFLWKGRLRIIEKGQDCFIRLEDKDSGQYQRSGEKREEHLS